MPHSIYRAKKIYTQTDIYDSRAEYRVQQTSKELKHHPEKRLKFTTEHTYTPDFIAPDGTLIEVKGYLSPDDRSKYKALKKCNPDMKFVFVFTKPNETISKASRTMYKDWARKAGFQWVSIDDFDPKLYGCS